MKYFLPLLLALSLKANAQLSRIDTLQTVLNRGNKDTVAWLYGGSLRIGLNEGFLHNWPAGGELSSLTVGGLANAFLVREFHRHSWSNFLDMNYGLFYAYSNRFIPRKLDDRIDFSSKYGYRLDTTEDFYFVTLFNLKSQFTKGYDYSLPNWDSIPTSEFLSPAYFILATGIEYRKDNNLQLFLSPAAFRLTVADREYTSRQPEGAFGIEYNKTTRQELGAYFSGRYTIDITPAMMYKTRVDLYSNYFAKDKKDSLGIVVQKDNPGNIDVLWDNLYSWKVSKFVSINFGLTVLYDNDIPYRKTYINENNVEVAKDEPGMGLGWLQIRQLFTLGFEYKF